MNWLNGWVEASHGPTMVFPAVFPMFVTHTRKSNALNDGEDLESLKASLCPLLDTTICQCSTAAHSPEPGPGDQCKSEETAQKRTVYIYLELDQHLGVKQSTPSIINASAARN